MSELLRPSHTPVFHAKTGMHSGNSKLYLDKTALTEHIPLMLDISGICYEKINGLGKDTPNSEALCLSNDPYAKDIDGIKLLPWQLGLKEIFALPELMGQQS